MGQAISISFEGDKVKVIFATLKGRKLSVDDALVLPEEKFDSFLSEQKIRDFTVSVDFKSFYQDTIYIPPVRKGLVKPLIQSEIRKKNPIDKIFSLIYFKTGEKLKSGKKLNEYFVFYVDQKEIDELVETFLSKGKRIKALYPNMVSVLKILPVQQTPYLCLYETGGKKNLFLINRGKVLFTRSTQSIGEGIIDFDIQNINMTVNHCRQTLRIDPEEILFVSRIKESAPTASETLLPITFMTRPEEINVDDERFFDFLIPISALGAGKTESIVNEEYRTFYNLTNLVQRSTAAFLILSVILGGLLGFHGFRYQSLNKELSSLRLQGMELQPALEAYRLTLQELGKEKPLIDFANKIHSEPSVSMLMKSLTGLQKSPMNIQRLEVNPKAMTSELELKINGRIESENLYHAQKALEKMTADLRLIKGIQEVDGNFSIQDKSFTIETSYKKTEGL